MEILIERLSDCLIIQNYCKVSVHYYSVFWYNNQYLIKIRGEIMVALSHITEDFINVMKSTKNLSSKTEVAYRSDLKDFCVFLEENQLDDSVVLKYVQHLSQHRELKDSTISRKLIVLKMFFEYLHNQGHIQENYFLVHSFKFKKERKLPKVLAPKETAKLLVYAKRQKDSAQSEYELWKSSRNLALIDILISTGIRIAEAADISLGDIISSERTILIHGKGRKQRLIYIYRVRRRGQI